MSENFLNIDKLINVLKFDQLNPMLFNTGLFLILFIIFICIYQLLRKHRTLKFLFVIAFSLYFYYKSSAEYCFILLGVCISDFLLGIWMDSSHRTWMKRIILIINLILNIGMLVYFKYLNLLIDTVANFSGQHFDALNIILPAGISFFTFRSISYMVDIYRGHMRACRDFLAYTFYLTFFPPLLAGPVVRAKDMLPQVEQNPVATKIMVSEGIFLIMCGLIKKVIVADFISANFVDRIFDNPALYTGFEVMMAVYGFVIQLYCDFSGYSDMAIGIALLMGYQFLDNFNAPFKSQSPTEFWRRWHISLSTWLRDYLYIPLGGNRKGKGRTYLNSFMTMLIGGLWHGASWMYLIWGGIQGGLLAGHKALKSVFPSKKQSPEKRWRRAVNIFITFNLIAISFVFFRADSLDKVGVMWQTLTTNFHPEVAPQFIEGYLAIVLVMVGAMVVHFAPTSWTGKFKQLFHATPLLIQAVILALVILIVIQTRQSDVMPFIYFKY